MSTPRVSILTPFKNTEQFLADCLDSVVNQSFRDWEMILVDDHSTDNSYQLVKEYSNTDRRIKVFKNKGNGIIHALRTALSNSSGQLISRMDSDDIMAINKIESLVSDLNTYGQGHIATGLVQYFNKDGVNDGYAKYEAWLNKLTICGNNFDEIYKECVIPSPCWMVYREDFEACGAFDEDRYPEDYDLTFRYYQNKLKVIASNRLLHHWRDYPTRTSRTHIHYAQNYFLDIKLHYFLDIDYDKNKTLTVWGAGTKGKTIAKHLVDKGIQFRWICDNPKKIGKHIYGVPLEGFNTLEQLDQPQSIVTVANAEAQSEIRSYFTSQGMYELKDYFFFC